MISDRAIKISTDRRASRLSPATEPVCRRIEVELHDWDRSDADAGRIHEAAAELPWEYLISAATRSEGRYQSLLITRLFRNGSPADTFRAPPEQVLFVESAPGRLKDDIRIRRRGRSYPGRRGCDRPFEDDMLIKKTSQIAELREEDKERQMGCNPRHWRRCASGGLVSSRDSMTFFRRSSRLSGTKISDRVRPSCSME